MNDMTLTAELLKGLEDVARQAASGRMDDMTVLTVEPPRINVREIREALGMSQREFAQTFRFATKTVQNWEQGTREPEGPARAYLAVIKRVPEAVMTALADDLAAYKVSEVSST
jgi:putative transcriptional regulator